MPELPDMVVYAEALARRVIGQPLAGVRVLNPFLLRTAVPPLEVARLFATMQLVLGEWSARLPDPQQGWMANAGPGACSMPGGDQSVSAGAPAPRGGPNSSLRALELMATTAGWVRRRCAEIA